MFFHKEQPQYPYDSEQEEAVVRSSICTGEKAAGFRNKQTGVFHEVMLIRTDSDLESFQKQYHLSTVKIIY